MESDQEQQELTRFGRIPLGRIADGWAESSPYNPRLLAEWVADTVASLGPLEHPVNTLHVAAYSEGKAIRGVLFTHGEVSQYFSMLSKGSSTHPIRSGTQQFASSNVLVWRQWIEQVEREAIARADMVAHLAIPAGATAIAAAANDPSPTAPINHSIPSGSAPGYLALRQARLRQDGEKTAGEKLDDANGETERLRQELETVRARLTASDALLQQARDDACARERDVGEVRREMQRLSEILSENAGIIAFMDEDNPLSPVEGRRMLALWCDVTENGQEDPVTQRGVGLKELCARWLSQHFGAVPESTISRYTWALGWPARKNGGAPASPRKKNL